MFSSASKMLELQYLNVKKSRLYVMRQSIHTHLSECILYSIWCYMNIRITCICVCEYSCTWWLPYFQDFLQHQKVNAWACKIYCCPNSAIIILQGHKYAKNGIIVMIFCVCMLASISITTKHKNEVGENMKIAEAFIIPWCM